jgi:hypothetical protein
MRALFSLVGLLVVVVIVMLIARKQLQAVAPSAMPATPATSAAPAGAAPTVQEQTRGVQQKVLQDINQSLQQGAERATDSKP